MSMSSCSSYFLEAHFQVVLRLLLVIRESLVDQKFLFHMDLQNKNFYLKYIFKQTIIPIFQSISKPECYLITKSLNLKGDRKKNVYLSHQTNTTSTVLILQTHQQIWSAVIVAKWNQRHLFDQWDLSLTCHLLFFTLALCCWLAWGTVNQHSLANGEVLHQEY